MQEAHMLSQPIWGDHAMPQQTPPERFDLAGMAAELNSLFRLKTTLSKNGLRYPIAPYGIESDVRTGVGVSYAEK
jgi:hypothetical protein